MARRPQLTRSPSPSAVGLPVPGVRPARRTVLRGMLAGGAFAAVPSLAACGGGDSGGGEGAGTVTFGSNESGTTFAEQRQAQADAFTERTGTQVSINAVDHNTFQENINTYLQGNADDMFTWFAGYRMQFFAEQGLISDVSDVFPLDGIPESFVQASTAEDGNQYFVPQQYYPWAVFYRRSLFEENGYTPPTTLDEMVSLCQGMQSDGLVPIAFADKDGWPAMGTFDVLNMRINGFDFHQSLMAGDEAWDGAEVRAVFETWRDLLPYHQTDALGRTWQEAAQSLQRKEAGMYLLGTFLNEQFPDEEDDLDLFTFPEVDPAIGATAIDAPIDGFCLSADPDNPDGAKEFMTYLASADALEVATEATGLAYIAATENADTSLYSELQRKSAELVGQAENLAQFLDRDTRPDFASTVVIPSLQTFLGNPDDIDGVISSLESQKQSIFGS